MIALVKRALILAFRAGGGFGLALAFYLNLVRLVPLAVGPETGRLAEIAPGILWLGALLAVAQIVMAIPRVLAEAALRAPHHRRAAQALSAAHEHIYNTLQYVLI